MTYEEFLAEWRSTATHCKVHTSGSTGKPKEILLPKGLMKLSAIRTNAFFGIPAGAHIHSCISPDFIGGKMMAVRAEAGGLNLTWETPSSRPEVLTRFAGQLPELVALVPAQMLHILDNIPLDGCGHTVWLLGGSAIDPSLRRRIAGSGLNAWETYGMTETSSHIALRKVESEEEPFHPLPDVRLSLNEDGCLVINQYGQEVVTNDLATLTPEGSFRILGRADNVIITGGRKVNPESVEAFFFKVLHPLGIKEVMLVGEPDEKWGQRLELLLATGSDDLDRMAVAEVVREIGNAGLNPHEIPKSLRFVEHLPHTQNGKLRRK